MTDPIFTIVLSHVLEILQFLIAFESYIISDWLNRTVSQSEVVLLSNLQNLGEKDRDCS